MGYPLHNGNGGSSDSSTRWSDPVNAHQTWKVGAVSSLSGKLALLVVLSANAVKLAVKEINDAGGDKGPGGERKDLTLPRDLQEISFWKSFDFLTTLRYGSSLESKAGAMRDVELYKAILGFTPPWPVFKVGLDVKGQQRGTVGGDPGRELGGVQVAPAPRLLECPTHGVDLLQVFWAGSGSQFTALFERFTIDVFQEWAAQGGADLLCITWDEAWGDGRTGGALWPGPSRARGRGPPPGASGIWSTSRPRSSFTSEAWISTHTKAGRSKERGVPCHGSSILRGRSTIAWC
jgi:hypothetical protein